MNSWVWALLRNVLQQKTAKLPVWADVSFSENLSKQLSFTTSFSESKCINKETRWFNSIIEKEGSENYVILEKIHYSAQMWETRDQHNWVSQWLCEKEHDNILKRQNGIFFCIHDKKEKRGITYNNRKWRSQNLSSSVSLSESLEWNLLYM